MRFFIVALTALVAALTVQVAISSPLPIVGQELLSENLLKNPGFENGKQSWTASGGATSTANTTAKAFGSYGYEWDSNSASQTLLQSVTIPNGLKGKNGAAYCMIKAASGSPTHTITVDDGTNTLATATISTNTTSFTRNLLNFPFPTSGSVRIKITSVAADEPSIYIDNCFIGDAFNVFTDDVNSDDTAYSMTISAVTTAPTRGSGVTELATWSRIGDKMLIRYNYKQTGAGSAGSGTYLFGLPSGYSIDTSKLTVSTVATQATVGGGQSYNNNNIKVWAYDSTHLALFAVPSTSLGSATAVSSSYSGLDNATQYYSFWALVPISGWTSGTAIKPDQSDFGWTRDDAVVTPVNFGTVTVNGFFKKKIGDQLCIRGTFTAGTTAASQAYLTLNSAYTIDLNKVAPTAASIWNTGGIWNGLYNTASTAIYAVLQSGVFYSDGSNADRVFFATRTGSQAFEAVNASTIASSGNKMTISDLCLPISGWSNNQSAPLLVGGLTSASTGTERIERVKYYTTAYGTVCSANPCGVNSSDGGVTVTWNATGDYTINFPVGRFSASPTCFGSFGNSSNGIVASPTYASISSTAFRFKTINTNTGSALNSVGDMLCMGPR